MPQSTTRNDIIRQLEDQISDETGNMHEDNLEQISKEFNDILNDAMLSFNSDTFDKDGFVQRLKGLNLDENGKEVIKNVLNNVRADYINMDAINQSELLLRRDIKNVCTQMPEMTDVIKVNRDGVVEANVATGQISRSLVFENHEDNESYISQAEEVEKHHDMQMAAKNFIVPQTLGNGEFYVHIVPFSKLFAELEMIRERKNPHTNMNSETVFHESIPNYIRESFESTVSLYSEDNVKLLTESVSSITNIDAVDDVKVESTNSNDAKKKEKDIDKGTISSLLKNIEVTRGASELVTEMGDEGFRDFLFMEYTEDRKRAKDNLKTVFRSKDKDAPEQHFMEAMASNMNKVNAGGMFNMIDQDDIDVSHYKHIKGCYIKYLDPLKMIPIRIDRRIIGYYYVTTTMDLQTTTTQPNGMIDLSYQHYTKDKNMVDQLANIIIRTFDKRMIDKNIQLKNEIVEIVMAHKFAEGKLNFIYIPEDEIVRFAVNEDENGKGHSILENSMFSARNYIMLNTYNMMYTLNNNMTRIHYLKSSGLNKDYAAQIQRTMRKFQSRRITIDDIYSYQGVLNKIGGMGEMVLPAGRNDYKALETDTIEPVPNPISIEFLEQQRRQALSSTGSPNLLIINAIDEVDFAKTLEMANTRQLSNIASYKIDFNNGLTILYKKLLKYETDMEDDIIESFRFQFDPVKQQELNITAEMIQNFNALVEIVMSIFYSKDDMEDEKGNPTAKQMFLRKELAKEYLPQLNIDALEDIVKRVNIQANDNKLQKKVDELSIEDKDIAEIEGNES